MEDEEMVRKLVRRTLESEGYTVFEAGYGPEAIHICQQKAGRVDLLLADVILPGGMNGPELAAQLKLEHPALKVLYISGYTEKEIIHLGVLEPGVAFLQKPFRPAELLRKVREVLDIALE